MGNLQFILLSIFILASFIGQVVIIRFFFKQLATKLHVKQVMDSEKEIIDPISVKNSQKLPLNNQNLQNPMGVQVDRPEKNHVMEVNDQEEDYVDGMALPHGVKVEVEGGDSQVPPGFDEKGGEVAPK